MKRPGSPILTSGLSRRAVEGKILAHKGAPPDAPAPPPGKPKRMSTSLRPLCPHRPFWAWLPRALACAAAALTFSTAATAADDTPAPATRSTTAADAGEADLILMNRHVVRFRSSLLGSPAAQRAERGKHNLDVILARNEDDTVQAQHNPMGSIILVGGQLAFILTHDDVDKLGGETLETLTHATQENLRQVIAETRESRDSEALVRGAAAAAGATAVALVLALALTRLHRGIGARLVSMIDRKAERLKLGGTELIRRDRILAAVGWLMSASYWLLVLLLGYAWLGFVLARFPFTRAWGEQLNGYLLGIVLDLGKGIITTLPNLLIAGIMFLLARGVVGLLKPLFDHVSSGEPGIGWLDRDTVEPTRKITNILIWIFALVMAYPYLPGAHTEAFKGMSVLIGLMVSLGASSIVGQGASGLILMYSRTLRTGEYVRIGEHEGTIVAISLFTTRLRTGRGAEITLPNAMIVGNATRNYSRTVSGEGFMVDTTVTIGYDTPWRQVEAMLIDAAARTPGILASPTPRVYQTALSDYYPEYCLVAQALPAGPLPRAEVISRLHANIQDVFNEHGVQIMSPHYMADPATDKVVPRARWFTPPARPEGE